VLDVKRLDKELALRVRLDYGDKSKMALGAAKVGVHNSTAHCSIGAIGFRSVRYHGAELGIVKEMLLRRCRCGASTCCRKDSGWRTLSRWRLC
jgi:hypothetical protein